MQVYEGLPIVTNKVTEEEQRGVPHHLLGVLNPNADFTATDFCDAASLAVESIIGRDRLPLIVGGSNSYIEALIDDDDYMFRSKYKCCFIWVDVSICLCSGHSCRTGSLAFCPHFQIKLNSSPAFARHICFQKKFPPQFSAPPSPVSPSSPL
jgi:hypothetical protein